MTSYSVRDISLVKEIDRARADLNAVKARQAMGNDIVTIHPNTLLTTYDITVPASGGSGYAYRYVTFDADHQDNVMGAVRFRFTIGDTTTLAEDADYDVTIQDLTFYQANPKRLVYGYNIYNYHATLTLYLKVYVYATDTGTIYVTEEEMPS